MKTNRYNTIVETPKGSRNKYKYDAFLKMFKLDKVLPAGFTFPYDFGFFPNTNAEDGDPLDVMIISDEASFTGCLVECRVLGAIEANQTDEGKTVRNDRIIALPVNNLAYKDIHSLRDLDKTLIDEIEHFFYSYHKYNGVKFEPLKTVGPEEAIRLIEKSSNGDT